MKKCLICGKRILFWQKKLKTEDKVIHNKCSIKEESNEVIDEKTKEVINELINEEKEIETPIEEITGATIDSPTGEKNSSLQETSYGDKELKNELSLSDKIICASDPSPQAKVLFVSDVQDFIKKINEGINELKICSPVSKEEPDFVYINDLKEIINKNAGEELI